jgi:hypothetical protein
MARASNWRKNWQLETTGETYAQWQDAKLTASGSTSPTPTAGKKAERRRLTEEAALSAYVRTSVTRIGDDSLRS